MNNTMIRLGFMFAAITMAVAADEQAWVAPARVAQKKNPVPSDSGSVAKGKAVYFAECQSCHGTSGRGDGPAAGQLGKNPGDLTKLGGQSDGALFWKITEGKKPMPSFSKKFSEEQRWCVINYLHSLGK